MVSMRKQQRRFLLRMQSCSRPQFPRVHGIQSCVFHPGIRALVLGILLVIGILVSVAIGVVLTVMITRPLKAAVGQADLLAHGDFSQTIDLDQKDEVGQLVQAMNTMAGNLRGTFQ